MRGFKELWNGTQAEGREEPACCKINPCGVRCGGENQHTEGLTTDTAWKEKGTMKQRKVDTFRGFFLLQTGILWGEQPHGGLVSMHSPSLTYCCLHVGRRVWPWWRREDPSSPQLCPPHFLSQQYSPLQIKKKFLFPVCTHLWGTSNTGPGSSSTSFRSLTIHCQESTGSLEFLHTKSLVSAILNFLFIFGKNKITLQ